jgi:hypothetical protein
MHGTAPTALRSFSGLIPALPGWAAQFSSRPYRASSARGIRCVFQFSRQTLKPSSLRSGTARLKPGPDTRQELFPSVRRARTRSTKARGEHVEFYWASRSWHPVKACFGNWSVRRHRAGSTGGGPALPVRGKSVCLRLNGDGLLLGVGGRRGGHALFSLAWLADIDAAFEEGSILDADALGNHITSQGTFAADVHPVAGIDVAAHLAQNHYFAGRDIRGHLSIAANRDPVARQVDGTLDLAVDVQRLGTRHFALDYQALANRGLIGSCRRCGRSAGGAGGG